MDSDTVMALFREFRLLRSVWLLRVQDADRTEETGGL